MQGEWGERENCSIRPGRRTPLHTCAAAALDGVRERGRAGPTAVGLWAVGSARAAERTRASIFGPRSQHARSSEAAECNLALGAYLPLVK